MRPVVRIPAVLILLALPSAPGCVLKTVPVKSLPAPIRMDLRDVAIELAPEVAGYAASGRSGPDSAELTSGGTTVRITGPDADMNLTVNDHSYGPVKKGDSILVEQDQVSVNGEVRQAQDSAKEK
jgi:hypothetical protein